MTTKSARNRPTTLLLSRPAFTTWGSRIDAAAGEGEIAFVLADEAGASDAPCGAEIAFMTREVTGKSGRGAPTPELVNFDAVVRRSPNLQWLQIHPAGADRRIYAELRARGVRVTTASGATAVTVAHSTLGGIISVNRRFPLLADAQRRHAWEPRIADRSPRDLKGQHAVVVGLGPIGRTLAPLLKMLGMRVTGIRRTLEPVDGCDRTTTYEQLDAVLPTTDWLVLCCPASPLTRGLLHAARIEAMPDGAHVANVSRGSVVVEADIVAALQSGKLGGAYLDVFEHEPLPSASPLWDLPNVLVSPHTASHSLGQAEAVFDIFLDNLARWRAGRELRNDVDRLG